MSDYYGSLSEADTYFSKKLYRDLWYNTDPTIQAQALYDATERIDRFNFQGNKTDEAQELQFPRNGQDEVPKYIKHATFEIAYQLIDGNDPEVMYNLLRKSSISVGPSRSSNDTKLIPEHIANGIPSLLAWSFIKPYLRDRTRIVLQRS